MQAALRGDPLVGVEHEFYLRAAGQPVDFRTLIDDLDLPGRRIDLYDPRAYRLDNGHLITADDAEAEYAIAPVPVGPGYLDDAVETCGIAAAELRSRLPDHIGMVGASTHVSVSCPDLYATRIAQMLTHHAAAPLMLIAEDHRSYGLLVRPRYGRVEIGLDYAGGPDLRPLLALATAVVGLCVDVLRGDLDEDALPTRLDPRWTHPAGRPGYHVGRRALGGDLPRIGRDTLLRRADGGFIDAGTHLQETWKAARPSLEAHMGGLGLDDIDDIVAGTAPLPMERGKTLAPVGATRPATPNPFSEAMAPIDRPAFSARVAKLSWDLAVFAITGHHSAYAVVPRAQLSRFSTALRHGALDPRIEAHLAEGRTDRAIPDYPEAVAAVGLYDRPTARLRIATPDRTIDDRLWLEDGSPLASPRLLPPAQPLTTWLSDVDPTSAPTLRSVTRPHTADESDAGTEATSARTKRETTPPPLTAPPVSAPPPVSPPPVTPPMSTPPPDRSVPWIWIIAVAVILVIVIVVLTGGGDDDNGDSPPPVGDEQTDDPEQTDESPPEPGDESGDDPSEPADSSAEVWEATALSGWGPWDDFDDIVRDRERDGVVAGDAVDATELVGASARSDGATFTEVGFRFAGDARSTQAEDRVNLSGGFGFIGADGTYVDVLWDDDGSVKISDKPSAWTIEALWESPDTIIFFIDGVGLVPGAIVAASMFLDVLGGINIQTADIPID